MPQDIFTALVQRVPEKTAGGCLIPNMKEGGAKSCRGNIVTKISGLIEDE